MVACDQAFPPLKALLSGVLPLARIIMLMHGTSSVCSFARGMMLLAEHALCGLAVEDLRQAHLFTDTRISLRLLRGPLADLVVPHALMLLEPLSPPLRRWGQLWVMRGRLSCVLQPLSALGIV